MTVSMHELERINRRNQRIYRRRRLLNQLYLFLARLLRVE